MVIYFIILIIIIIIFFIFKLKKLNIEYFDAKISNLTKEGCGELCTETFGCLAFAYDDITKKCYISKNPILFQPTKSMYAKEYEIEQYRCNKTNPIRTDIDDIDNLDQNQLRNNMFYSCQNNELDDYTLNKIVNNKIETIYKTNSSDDTMANSFENINYEYYPLYKINWPPFKKELTPCDYQNNILNDYITFEKKNRMYDGEYLYPYKCVKNVPENVCIQTCSKNNDCVGVEYNPYYLEKLNNGAFKVAYNICCPKRTIIGKNERTKHYENGYFYLKKHSNKLNKNNTFIINN